MNQAVKLSFLPGCFHINFHCKDLQLHYTSDGFVTHESHCFKTTTKNGVDIDMREDNFWK